MRAFVVDASVVVKWFVPQVHSESAARFLDADFRLLVPDLLFPEFGNTLWKKIRRGSLTQNEAAAILSALDKVPLHVHSSAELLPVALELATTLDRTVYDALYLSIALGARCKMVTADRKFHSALMDSAFADSVAWVEDGL